MENIFDRLQFLKHEEVFQTREDAYNYVINHQIRGDYPTITDPSKNLPALFGEPMVLLYENEDYAKGPNVILAIGSVGKGTADNKNRTFFIDTHKTEEEIEALNIKVDELEKLIKVIPLDSDTINMSVGETPDGTVISGDVKIADYRIVDGRANYNIIQTEGNKGIYAFVDMDYDPYTATIKFNVNGVTKEVQLPPDQRVVRGWYDPVQEAIILKLADESQVKVLVTRLIEEWTVLPDGRTISEYDVSGHSVNYTPVAFNKVHVGSKATEHEGIYEWQDVLEADINLADHISDNILHKDRTGRYLYVKGTADNIKYKDGLTVKDALDSADAKISNSANNLIYKRQDGIYAAAMVGYNAAENKLTYTYSDGLAGEIKEIEFQLNSVKLLEDITYDPTKEVIVIRYIDAQGEYRRVEIPVADIIEEWDVNNEGHNINLNKYRSQGSGKDILAADAKIHVGNNNILEDLNHELYVNGISENIKYDITGETTVKDVLDNLSSATDDLNDKINQEVSDRIAGLNRVDNLIGSGFTEDPHENITYKFEQLQNIVNDESVKLQNEIDRSISADTIHDGRLDSIDAEIGDGFGPRNTVRDEINNLHNEISAASEDISSRLTDVINEDKSINVETRNDDNGKPTIKVVKTNLSEEIEDNKPNIIKLNADGLYAGVDLIYEFNEEVGTNQLIFKTTNGTKTYDLKTNSVVDKIYYDPAREAIIIEYTVNGHRMPDVVIPVGDLINEWRVWDGHEGAVQLEKVRIASGASEQDVLKASVVISDHEDNIITNDSGSLYVSGSGITANKVEIDLLKPRMDDAEGNINLLENALNSEHERAVLKENEIIRYLNDEIQRSITIDDSLTNAVSGLTDRCSILTDSLNTERTRAISAETDLGHRINEERTRAISAETDLGFEITNLKSKDNDLQNQINGLNTNLLNETNRAIAAEGRLFSGLTEEIERAKFAEKDIELALSGETVRATTQEEYLLGLINIEADKRESGDSLNAYLIELEERRAKDVEDRIEESVTTEANRAEHAEESLSNRISGETSERQIKDNELYALIADERTDRGNEDSRLESLINQESNRASVAENAITESLQREITRSIDEDSRLFNLISGETDARRNADDELAEAIRKATLTFDDTTSIDFTKTTGNVVTADVKLQGGDNIIKIGEGLYATVSLSYDGARNTIKLITSNGEQEAIQLNTVGSLIDGMEYDAANRALVIKYHDAAGNPLQISFPVNQLFNDWEVNNPSEKSAVELTKTSPIEPDDPDKLSARILITDDHNGDGKPDQGSNNLIEIRNNGLYVDGSAISAATATTECLDRELDAVERAIFGNQMIGECGEGFEYEAPNGSTYIYNATNVNNATYILDQSIKRLSSYTENIDNRVNIVSAKTDCNKEELKTVENNILGMPLLNECGEGDTYRPNENTNYIFSGTSFNDVDIILDREIKKTNVEINILNQKVDDVIEDVDCVSGSTIALYKLLYGQNKDLPSCGDGAVYTPYQGCIISGATSFMDADEKLNEQICNMLTMWKAGETPSTKSDFIDDETNKEFQVDVKLSHGNHNGMSDDDLMIYDNDGAYIDPTRTEFTDTNALRIVHVLETPDGVPLPVNTPYNGIYLSNVWDCGLYYSETVDADAIAAASEAGYNTNYRTDENSSAQNYNYMNNVRQNDI